MTPLKQRLAAAGTVALAIGVFAFGAHVLLSSMRGTKITRQETTKDNYNISDLITDCWREVRLIARFPTEVKFESFLPPSESEIVGRVVLLSPMGAKTPHIYSCKIKGRQIIKVTIRPG